MMNIRNILHSGEVVRFHNHVGIEKQKNSEHQWAVALILQHIYPQCSKLLLLAAMTHDSHEYFTGDIPFPTKHASRELVSILEKLEKEWESANGVDFNLHIEEKIALKLADTLEGMRYCVLQVRNGRINAKRPFRKWRSYITDIIAAHRETNNEDLKSILLNATNYVNRIIQEMEEL